MHCNAEKHVKKLVTTRFNEIAWHRGFITRIFPMIVVRMTAERKTSVIIASHSGMARLVPKMGE